MNVKRPAVTSSTICYNKASSSSHNPDDTTERGNGIKELQYPQSPVALNDKTNSFFYLKLILTQDNTLITMTKEVLSHFPNKSHDRLEIRD